MTNKENTQMDTISEQCHLGRQIGDKKKEALQTQASNSTQQKRFNIQNQSLTIIIAFKNPNQFGKQG
ncbi:hypothetical protein A3K86_15780 [Photobacterium jeanii]|uniref:Uncharacterized protein n=1 Tax=Photobacterium jeanii TaxID=858640 RepID=A0A178K8V7_9GAMM|nr:hypothetical protein [Photobacterium jeanii]OAN13122.1 hypothetical protein A3K86_15780 [Photobacterium jeanii]PST89273.1 hypothetical protein C9I91_14225 [Photobacterium jeanii]